MNLYHFERLIKKFSTTFQLEIKGETTYKAGEPITQIAEIREAIGAILPVNMHKIYQSGGTLTQQDRELYSRYPIAKSSEIIYKSDRYSIEGNADYSDFSNAYIYTLKWLSQEVTNNDPNSD